MAFDDSKCLSRHCFSSLYLVLFPSLAAYIGRIAVAVELIQHRCVESRESSCKERGAKYQYLDHEILDMYKYLNTSEVYLCACGSHCAASSLPHARREDFCKAAFTLAKSSLVAD
ncbi:hypothetical protein ISCGN_026286 [Ixodes scapularis]